MDLSSLFRKGLVLAVVALGSSVLLGSCGSDDPTPTLEPQPTATPVPQAATATPTLTALQRLIEAAAAEGQVIIEGGPFDEPEAANEAEAAIKAMWGIDLDIQQVPNPVGSQNAHAAKLIKEAEAGQRHSTDMFTGTQSTAPLLITSGVAQRVNWRAFDPSIPEDAVDGMGAALAFGTRMGGIAYNTNEVSPDDVPKSFDDLLDPKWKGRIATTPYVAVWDRATLYTPGEEIEAFLKELSDNGNLAGLIGCGGDVDRIVTGEFAMLAMICSDNGVYQLQDKGAPIEIAFIPETTDISHGYLVIPQPDTINHPNAAILYAIFNLTPEGQALHRKYNFWDLHYIEGNETYNRVEALRAQGINPPVIDTDDVIAEQESFSAWAAKFRTIVRGG